ncbi:nuclear transport factor 2 family protein [Novosphingobium sp. M1R2S20]|uniref:Nuclear transport factor 2 family protein n=1 Tax=Novosphingobium rhizovicinum TaxID=3228928 RepID=A0ABV3RB17_9SPHN
MSEADRLKQVEARLAIADLVHAYALAVRRDRPEDVEQLFAPGATFEVREGAPDREDHTVVQRFESPQDLVSYLVSGKGRSHPVPLIHNLLVEVHGDRAFASSMMAGPIFGTGNEVFGEYADSFIQHGGEWRFSSRVFTLFRDPAVGERDSGA